MPASKPQPKALPQLSKSAWVLCAASLTIFLCAWPILLRAVTGSVLVVISGITALTTVWIIRWMNRRASDPALLRIRESDQMLQLLIESSPLAIIVLDTHKNVTVWNKAAELLFGWRADEVIGCPNPIVPDEE